MRHGQLLGSLVHGRWQAAMTLTLLTLGVERGRLSLGLLRGAMPLDFRARRGGLLLGRRSVSRLCATHDIARFSLGERPNSRRSRASIAVRQKWAALAAR